MSRSTDTLVGFLVGAAAGGITALLLAPESGKSTRDRLRHGGEKLVNEGKEMVTQAATAFGDAAREKSHAVGEAARQQVSAVRGAVTEAKDTYRRELDKG